MATFDSQVIEILKNYHVETQVIVILYSADLLYSKSHVANEISIPPSNDVMTRLPLSTLEKYCYQQLVEERKKRLEEKKSANKNAQCNEGTVEFVRTEHS